MERDVLDELRRAIGLDLSATESERAAANREQVEVRATRIEVYQMLAEMRRPLVWREEYETAAGLARLRAELEEHRCSRLSNSVA